MASQPWNSPVAGRLAELGFVREYPGMTFYAAWASGESETMVRAKS